MAGTLAVQAAMVGLKLGEVLFVGVPKLGLCDQGVLGGSLKPDPGPF